MTLYNVVVFVLESVVILALCGMTLIGVGFLALPVLYLIEKITGARKAHEVPHASITNDALLEVLVQLPVYNEPHVVVGLLDAVVALDIA